MLNHDGPQAVNLRCIGKVLRADRLDASPDGPETNFQVAATLERYEFVRGRGASLVAALVFHIAFVVR